MAKKKKHRRPIAPPVHSAPETVHAPPRPAAPEGASSRPEGAQPPGEPGYASPSLGERAPARARPGSRRKPAGRRRRRRLRPYVITGLIVAAIVGAFVARSVLNSGQTRAYERLAASAGCGEIRSVGDLSREHVDDEAVEYATSPPAGGAHAAASIPAGVYEAAFAEDPKTKPNIYQSVHSLEHGYVIVWHRGVEGDDLRALERAVRGEQEVILVPYAKMPRGQKMAMSAWGKVQTCREPSTSVVDGFVDRFRNARSAPEASVP